MGKDLRISVGGSAGARPRLQGRTHKAVTLGLTGGGHAAHEHGRFAQYAGLVYVSARHKCIDVTGVIGNAVRAVRGVHRGQEISAEGLSSGGGG